MPNLEDCPPNLGMIVTTMLDPDSFYKFHSPNNWLLADGREVLGTKYAIYISNFLPDLRGCFIRGKNYNRDLKSGNAQGNLVLGQFQGHEFSKHFHDFIQMIHNNSIDGIDSAVQHSGEHHSEPRETQKFGGSETRPSNVTVNYFICVN